MTPCGEVGCQELGVASKSVGDVVHVATRVGEVVCIGVCGVECFPFDVFL
jgi:hypothetical protein